MFNGICSANENMTISCDDTQISVNEEIQTDSIQTVTHGDSLNTNDEIQDCSDLINGNHQQIPIKLNQEPVKYNTPELINLDINHVENCELTCELLDSFESAEIDNKTTENIFSVKYDSSNGYVTKNDGNLLPLIETNLNSETNESLMINHTNMKVLSSKDNQTDNYWNNTLITELSSNRNVALIKRLVLAGIINNQTDYNYPQIDLPLDYASNELLGVSRDFDDDAFIWNNSGKEALFTVDMVNETTDEILGSNLNEQINMNSISPFEIGVDASLKALNYFNSQGLNIQKGYPYLYVLTSAGQVKIKNTDTNNANSGIMEVFGYEINKNIYSIHIPLWKDLIFYYAWMNSTNKVDTISYALKYDITSNNLIESDEIIKQGNSIIYEMFFKQKNNIPSNNDYYHNGDSSSRFIMNEFITGQSSNSIDANSTNTTSNVTTQSNVEKFEENIKNEIFYTGNPFNILFTLISIVIISSVFGASYSKRKE